MNIDCRKVRPIDTPEEYLNLHDPVARYRGNPLIGALGPIRTKEQIVDLLTNKPPYDPSEISLPPHIRPHVAFCLRQFFMPGVPHIEAVKEIDLLIRQSYAHRNPLDPQYQRLMAADRDRLRKGLPIPQRYQFVELLGSAAIGPPGTGKTRSFDYGLRDFLPVVEHAYEIDGQPIAFKQVPAMKVNLFQDGSLKAFGREIFDQAELILNVPLRAQWNIESATANAMQGLCAQFCREFNAGIFVVDEFQFVGESHDGARRALNYFARLMNCIGIAVVVVGNRSTSTILKENLAASRRFVGSIPQYEPFKAGPLWSAFCKQLFRYRYVAEMEEAKELARELLSLSGGIADIAVKLFLLSQLRLFGRKPERLTKEVLRETSVLLFYNIQEQLLEIKGIAPEPKNVAALAKKMEEAFRTLSRKENERVGGNPIAELQEPASSITITPERRKTIAGKMLSVSEKDDALAALEELEIIEKLE